ncbi:unnamed protein product [Macrosiphum euphorbiae]|uniref:Reverse transcriptase domain-containing protein n=1 Tax=Macrosiphum euphorbiae TaxID=13131 RepID=A0AAV0X878_9HEMI|nr:unnamed protein product [Macrosiphum euphorbiae]
MYKSPNSPLQTNDLDILTNPNDLFLAAGDLNAKHQSWNCRTTNQAGRILHQHMETSNSYSICAPDSPTHYSYNSLHRPDILDIALVNLHHREYVLTNHNELTSDHNPIVMTISDSPITINPPAARKRINWKKFEQELSLKSPKLTTKLSNPTEIDNEVDSFTTLIKSTIEKCSYLINKPQTREPLSPDILLEIATKRNLRKDWQRTRHPAVKTMLNAQIVYVRNLLKEHRQLAWDRFTSTLNFQDQSLYKLNRRLLHKKPASAPLTTNSGQKIYDTKSKLELFADTMRDQFTANPGNELLEVNRSVNELNGYSTKSSLFTTPGEVFGIIKNLPSAKAPGHDNITNAALKHLPAPAIVRLSNLITACLRHSYFPTSWKTAIIVMIPKPNKNHNLPINYRPISLLVTMSKVFEKILLSHLNKYFKPRSEQHAFRHGHSTTTQLTKLIDDLVINTNNNRHTAAIFLDMEKAFDRVWHDGLIHKLHTMSTVPTSLIKIIKSFLSNRNFQIQISDLKSTLRTIEAGVPQGSCLSPLLYTLYINDLPSSPHVTTSLFADDTMFYSSNTSKNFAIIRLQRQVTTTTNWINKWRLKLNPQKTVCILFGTSRKEATRKIQILGQTIDWKNKTTYLGVTLDKALRLNDHVKVCIRKAKQARGALYPILNSRSPIPMPTRLSIYKLYIKPILLYASSAWGPLISASNWAKIEAVQNVAIRTITGAHFFTRNNAILNPPINSLRNEAELAARVFYHRNSQSTFAHIRDIGTSPAPQILTRRPRPINFAKSQ